MENTALATPEQERIHRDLTELISSGIADLYYDACAIRNSVVRPRAAALQIGHLFREIDSAVRAVLTTPAPPNAKKSNGDEGHVANVAAVLKVLELEETDERAALWKQFSNKKDPWHLTNFAHRRALGGVRVIDADFQRLCSEFDRLLIFVLDRIRTIATKLAKKLNEILAIAAPTPEDVKTLRNNVPSAPFIFDRIFAERLSANWIDALLADGFFAEPPPGAAVNAAMFAMRLAANDPGRARAILEQLPVVDDVFMANAYIVTIQKLPAGAYGDLFTKVLAWIEGPGFGESGAHLYIQFSKLIEHVGSCNDAARVVALTGALTVLSAPAADTERFFRDPDSLLDAEEYDAVLAATVDALYARDPQSLVTLLYDRLETTLGIEFPEAGTRPSGDEDSSEAWLASFDDPAIHTYSIKQVLAKRLAEALVRAYDADPAQLAALARALRARRFRVFTRLEAYLLLHAGDTGSALADAFVAEARHFWSYSPPLEFAELLRRRYPQLDEPHQKQIREYITAGLDPSTVSEDASGDDLRELGERRQINYLSLLSGYLPVELDSQLAQLNEIYGPSTHLVADVREPAHAIGPESPWTDEQLRSFSATELAQTLNAQPYAYGPSEQLRRAIADEPARFVAALDAFDHLEPGYVRSVIMGFSLALRQAKPFDWLAVIAFADRLLMRADATNSASDAAGDWSRVRYEICTLLTDGTSNHYPRFERARTRNGPRDHRARPR